MLVMRGPSTLPALWPGCGFVVEGLVIGSLSDWFDWEDLEGVEDEIVIGPRVLLFALEGRETAGVQCVVDVASIGSRAGDFAEVGISQMDASA